MRFKTIFFIIIIFAIIIVSFSVLSISLSDNLYIRLSVIFTGIGIAGFLALYIIFYFVKPVRKLEENIKKIEEGTEETQENTGSAETDKIATSYKRALSRLKDLQNFDKENSETKSEFKSSLIDIKNQTSVSFSSEISHNPSLFSCKEYFWKAVSHLLNSIIISENILIYLQQSGNMIPEWSKEPLTSFPQFIPPKAFITAFGVKPELITDYKIHSFLPDIKDYKYSLWLPFVFEKNLLGLINFVSKEPIVITENIKKYLGSLCKEIGVSYRVLKEYTVLRENYKNSVKNMAAIWEVWHPFIKGHSLGVENYALKIAEKLGLSEEQKYILSIASFYHDIGELGIPDSVLHKETFLSDAEKRTIQTHPLLSAEIISNAESRKKIRNTIQYHHEHYDGNGYPHKLSGNKIPLLSRILSVSDAFQAMISSRPYRVSMSREQAFDKIKKLSGAQFDPEIVNILYEVLYK